MTDLSLTILPETADDAVPIERLHERTFGPGRYAKSAYRLRERTELIKATLDPSFALRARRALFPLMVVLTIVADIDADGVVVIHRSRPPIADSRDASSPLHSRGVTAKVG